MGGGEGRWGGGAGACLTSINLHVSRGPSHLNYRKELNLCLLMKVKDLEVRDSSRVVSSYEALWSTFCLFTQVYKWVPATQFPGGRTPYNGLYGEAPPERGTLLVRPQVYEFEVYERVGKSVIWVCERA